MLHYKYLPRGWHGYEYNMSQKLLSVKRKRVVAATVPDDAEFLTPSMDRYIAAYEAARLQSFPDWYEFSGTKEQQFTMIGNAVPSMSSCKLAQSVISYLKLHEAHADKYSVLADFAQYAVDPRNQGRVAGCSCKGDFITTFTP